MAAPLVVSIPHQLGREEAKRRLQSGLTRAATSLPMLKVDEERWESDRLVFRVRALGQAATGHVDVADDHVLVEVTLPPLLQRFAQSSPGRDQEPRSAPADQTRLTCTVGYIALQHMKAREKAGKRTCENVSAFRHVSLPVMNDPEY